MTGATRARIRSQEARSLKQGSSQRQRWSAGRLMVLAMHGRAIVSSPYIGVRQKLDAVAELTSLGPVVHTALVVLLLAVTPFLPFGVWLAGALGFGAVRNLLYAALGVTVDPEPKRAAVAFGFLPVYALWRLVIQVKTLANLGDKPWIRTARHTDPAHEVADTRVARSAS